MTRHDEREPIPRAEGADGALRPRVAGELRQLRVGDNFSVPDPPHGGEDVSLELGPPFGVDLGIRELNARTPEVRLQSPEEALHFRHNFGADT
jgi:hypothetical protein